VDTRVERGGVLPKLYFHPTRQFAPVVLSAGSRINTGRSAGSLWVGSSRPFAALQDRPCERAVTARKRSSA